MKVWISLFGVHNSPGVLECDVRFGCDLGFLDGIVMLSSRFDSQLQPHDEATINLGNTGLILGTKECPFDQRIPLKHLITFSHGAG